MTEPVTALRPRRSLAVPADRDWFWRIVDGSLRGEEAAQLDALAALLAPLPDQDLVDYIALYAAMHAGLYSWRLWAAAYLINGGCSDDGFHYFRDWLISRGQRVTKSALADADSLAELRVEADTATFEWFAHVHLDAFRARSGGEYPPAHERHIPAEPSEPDWSFDYDDAGEMHRRLPRLAALYL